jgi:hypothetical protein
LNLFHKNSIIGSYLFNLLDLSNFNNCIDSDYAENFRKPQLLTYSQIVDKIINVDKSYYGEYWYTQIKTRVCNELVEDFKELEHFYEKNLKERQKRLKKKQKKQKSKLSIDNEAVDQIDEQIQDQEVNEQINL